MSKHVQLLIALLCCAATLSAQQWQQSYPTLPDNLQTLDIQSTASAYELTLAQLNDETVNRMFVEQSDGALISFIPTGTRCLPISDQRIALGTKRALIYDRTPDGDLAFRQVMLADDCSTENELLFEQQFDLPANVAIERVAAHYDQTTGNTTISGNYLITPIGPSTQFGYFVLKYNSIGNLLWSYAEPSSSTIGGSPVGFSGIFPGSQGETYLTKSAPGTGQFATLRKYSADGILLYERTFGGVLSFIYGVRPLPNGGAILGQFNGSFSGPGGDNGLYQILDSNGNILSSITPAFTPGLGLEFPPSSFPRYFTYDAIRLANGNYLGSGGYSAFNNGEGVYTVEFTADGTIVQATNYEVPTFTVQVAYETNSGEILLAGTDIDGDYHIFRTGSSGGSGGNDGVDLELAVQQSSNAPSPFQVYSVTITASNTGTETATGVSIEAVKPEGVVYEGGNEFELSAGNFDAFGGLWNLGTLAAGASETLTVNYFLLAPIAPDFYTQVLTQNETDADSTPGNGTPPLPNEDDEASSNAGTGGGGDPGTLTLDCNADVTVTAPAGASTAVVNYIDPTAASTCTTGPVSSIMVSGPASGSAFPIGETEICFDFSDPCGDMESCCIVITVLPGDTTPDEGCGFVQNVGPQFLNGSSRTVTATETASGFEVEFRTTLNNLDVFNTRTLSLDESGAITGTVDEQIPQPDQPFTVVTGDGADFNITYNDGDGNPIFSTDVSFDPMAGPILDQVMGQVSEANGGYLYVGTTVVDGPNNVLFFPFIIRFDEMGAFIGSDFLMDNDFLNAGQVIPRNDGIGDYLITFRSGNVDLSYIDATGTLVWKADLFNDTPSSRLYEVTEASDGSGVYVSTRDNNEGVLRKFDAATGATVQTIDYGAGAFPNDFVIFEVVPEFILLNNDDVVYAGRYNVLTAGFNTEYAITRVDAQGNTIWTATLPEGPDYTSVRALQQTSDGGFLFLALANNDDGESEAILLKTTSGGEFTPACTNGGGGGGGGSDGVDLELSLNQSDDNPGQYTVYSVTATLNNAGDEAATGVVVSLPLPDGVVYEGGNESSVSTGSFQPFPGTWNVGNLAANTSATLTVNYFLLDPTSPNTYAQVTSQNETDTDSSPGNGTPPTPNEDDEASTQAGSGGGGGGGGNDLPDLQVSALSVLNSPVMPGGVLDYTFTLSNTGSAPATGEFLVNAYLSTDPTLSADDIQDGTVPTGNYATGTVVTNIAGASTIPAGAAPGTYYLILVVDDNEDITESNESNNQSVAQVFQVVTDGGGGGGTGADLKFELEAAAPTAAIYTETSVTARLTNEGDAMATNIQVRIPRPAGVVYVGGNEFMTDVGNFSPFNMQVWTVSSLAPGASVVLTLNYFVLSEEAQTVYGEVIMATGNDPDSTPGNGTPPVPNEDDEAAVSFNMGGNGFAVQVPAGMPVALHSIAPNPVTQEHTYLTLDSSAEEEVTLEIYNAMGQRVKIQQETLRIGRTRILLDMTGYESGTYFLHLRGGSWRNAPVRVSLVRY